MANTIGTGVVGRFAYYAAGGTDLVQTPDSIRYDATNKTVYLRGVFVERSEYNSGFGYSGFAFAQYHATAATSAIAVIRGRGTAAAKTAVLNGDHLLNLLVVATTSNNVNTPSAYIRTIVNGAPVGTNVPTEWVFGTNNGAGLADRGKILKTGSLSFNQLSNFNGTTLTLSSNGSIVLNSGTGVAITGDVTATGEVTAYFSDRRLKTNISPIASALDKVMSITGYNYKANAMAESLGITNKGNQLGLMTQEVEVLMPELVVDSAFEGFKTIRYEKMIPVLVNAIKEQQEMITKLQKLIELKFS